MRVAGMQVKRAITRQTDGIAHRALLDIHVESIQVNAYGGMIRQVHKFTSLGCGIENVVFVPVQYLDAEAHSDLGGEIADLVQTLRGEMVTCYAVG
jgi:hypothetical protein